MNIELIKQMRENRLTEPERVYMDTFFELFND